MKSRFLLIILFISIMTFSHQIPSLIPNVRGSPIAEDGYEDNDIFSNAAYLVKQGDSDYFGNLCQADDDWFYFTLPMGVSNISIIYNGTLTDLSLELYNDAQGFLNQSNLMGIDYQTILFNNNGSSFYYYIKVSGDNLAEAYAIEFTRLHAFLDDSSEENDNWFRAVPLILGVESYIACDDDWFKHTFQKSSKITLRLEWNNSLGFMQLSVYTRYRSNFQGYGDSSGYIQLTFTIYDLGLYYCMITSNNPGISVPYNLTFREDDVYENNNEFNQCPEIGDDITIEGILWDEDWFFFWSTEYKIAYVQLQYNDSIYSINVDIYTAEADLVYRDVSNQTNKILEFLTNTANYYRIRIYGNYTGITYILTLDKDRDDKYEQNDVLENATLISYDLYFDERLILQDPDWYQINLPRRGTCRLHFGYDINSNMTFTLYNAESMEKIDLMVTTSSSINSWYDYWYLPIPARSKDTYVLLKVETNASDPYKWEYALTISKEQYFDYSYEPNDNIDSAQNIYYGYSSWGDLYADGSNEDWYKIEINSPGYEPQLLELCISYDRSDGYLEIRLLEDELKVINSSTLEITKFTIEIYQKCRLYLHVRNLNDTFCQYSITFNNTDIPNYTIGYPFQEIHGFLLPVLSVSCGITVLIITGNISINRIKNKKRHYFRELFTHHFLKGGY